MSGEAREDTLGIGLFFDPWVHCLSDDVNKLWLESVRKDEIPSLRLQRDNGFVGADEVGSIGQ